MMQERERDGAVNRGWAINKGVLHLRPRWLAEPKLAPCGKVDVLADAALVRFIHRLPSAPSFRDLVSHLIGFYKTAGANLWRSISRIKFIDENQSDFWTKVSTRASSSKCSLLNVDYLP
ncbi:Hypothetical predicted protein [Cloeon dipterum]|uniref:Uncharacterized protein n=1 Tax=Cloeon dipterum TaxID=197152 RepID=A0A8S1C1T6_9INSE|nr:Hypothetical predicted protein [Cloeon dipterum]